MAVLDIAVGMAVLADMTPRAAGGGDWAQGTIHFDQKNCGRLANHLLNDEFTARPITQQVFLAIQSKLDACTNHYEDARNKTMFSH